MFAVFDRHGDIGFSGRGEEGIFFQGTRFLSELVVHVWGARPLVLGYEGLDHITRRTRVQCHPAPKRISGSELHFEASLDPRESAVFHVAISTSATPGPEFRSISHSSAMAAANAEIKAASANLCLITSSNNRFNDWIKRSAADVEMMTIGNPEANYPYAGVPWFSTI